jgi:hypothetical protein
VPPWGLPDALRSLLGFSSLKIKIDEIIVFEITK